MRELTHMEMDSIGGGDDGTVVVVDLVTFDNDYGGPPNSTPVGSNPHSPNSPPSNHANPTTPNVKVWNSAIMSQLSQAQKDEVDAIATYGLQHGYTESQITAVIDQAYYESSLGSNENGNSTHFGLFQYNTATWAQNGYGSMNINSDADQITAMYNDLTTYEGRYASGQAAGSIPSTMSFEDYFEVKHHLGTNWTDFTDGLGASTISAYNGVAATLGIQWLN